MKRDCNQNELGNLICLPSGCFETAMVLRISLSPAMNCLLKQCGYSLKALSCEYKWKTFQRIYKLLLYNNFNSPKCKGDGTGTFMYNFSHMTLHEVNEACDLNITQASTPPERQKRAADNNGWYAWTDKDNVTFLKLIN